MQWTPYDVKIIEYRQRVERAIRVEPKDDPALGYRLPHRRIDKVWKMQRHVIRAGQSLAALRQVCAEPTQP